MVIGTETLRQRGAHLPASLACASSVNPTENVLTGCVLTSDISAVHETQKSRPPLNITPSGTSLTMRARDGIAQEPQ